MQQRLLPHDARLPLQKYWSEKLQERCREKKPCQAPRVTVRWIITKINPGLSFST